jgi:hypothetical protein
MIAAAAKFVRHHDVVDHLRVGWCQTGALEGTHHGEHSVLLVWQCSCAVVVPASRSGPEPPL